MVDQYQYESKCFTKNVTSLPIHTHYLSLTSLSSTICFSCFALHLCCYKNIILPYLISSNSLNDCWFFCSLNNTDNCKHSKCTWVEETGLVYAFIKKCWIPFCTFYLTQFNKIIHSSPQSICNSEMTQETELVMIWTV